MCISHQHSSCTKFRVGTSDAASQRCIKLYENGLFYEVIKTGDIKHMYGAEHSESIVFLEEFPGFICVLVKSTGSGVRLA